MSLSFYEITESYIDYLVEDAPHVFHNKVPEQGHSRKYIGIVLLVNDLNYFVPLSSYKKKHETMREQVDFLKVGNYAVLNLNCMFPVPPSEYHRVDFSEVQDERYKKLLLAEYLIIKQLEKRIRKNAVIVYNHKKKAGNSTPLGTRCNDFANLEILCYQYCQSESDKAEDTAVTVTQ